MAQPIDVQNSYLPSIITPLQDRERQSSGQQRVQDERFEQERKRAFEQDRVETQQGQDREETISSPFYKDYRVNQSAASESGGFSGNSERGGASGSRPSNFVQFVAETYESQSLAPFRPESLGSNLDALG